MKKIASFVFLFMVQATPSLSQSQSDAELISACGDALIVEDIRFSRDFALSLSILNTISQSTFEEKKKSFDWDLAAVIYDVPFESDMSWSDFQNHRQSVNKKFEYKENRSDAIRYSSTRLGETSLEAYKACLSRVGGDKMGFNAWIEYYDDDVVEMRASWKLPSPVTDPAEMQIRSVGATPAFDLPTSVEEGLTEQIVFIRDAGRNFRLFVQGGGKAFTLVLPPKPKYKVPCNLEHDNDTWKRLKQFSKNAPMVFYTKGGCRLEKSVSYFNEVDVELACIKSVQKATRGATLPESFDCSGRPVPETPLHQINYERNGKEVSFDLLGNWDCAAVKSKMTDLGMKIPGGLCK